MKKAMKSLGSIVVFAFLVVLPLTSAHAVPSFTRQTGLDCTACHTMYPELTPVGRDFKLRGYTSINPAPKSETAQAYYPDPLAAEIVVSYTDISKRQPDTLNQGTQNGNLLLPDTLSLFIAGRLADRIGAYSQFTYTPQDDHFTMDMTDIRYANEIKDLVYGISVNNNPTVSDVWNTVPAWSFPFKTSTVAPVPAAAPKIASLAQKVAGVTAYGWWDSWLLGEAGVYRSSKVGGNQPPNATDTEIVDGNAPYWRLAAEKNWGDNSLEVGAYGIYVRQFLPGTTPPTPGTGVTGPTDRFMDYAFDAQYQKISDPGVITAHTTWIHEKQDLKATNPGTTDKLDTFKIDGTYLYKRTVSGSLGYFNTWGNADAVVYTSAPGTGSANGKPNSDGLVAEIDYLPSPNTMFVASYTVYDKFNGARSNYDGFNRKASDNNTVYLAAWLMF